MVRADAREIRVRVDVELDPVLARDRLHRLDRLPDELARQVGRRMDRDAPGLYGRDVDEIADEPLHAPRGAPDDLRDRADRLRRRAAGDEPEPMRAHADRGQRRPEIVGDHREDLLSRARLAPAMPRAACAFSIASAARRASSIAIPTARWSKRRPEDAIPNASAPMIPLALRSGTPR